MEQDTAPQEEPEFIDKSAWVPHGHEVIPAAQLLNGRTLLEGSRYRTSDTPLIDKLLQARLIDASYHGIACRIINLFRMATTKQTYAANTIFSGSLGGSSNTDFCPMTVFIKVTRQLNVKELFWISLICGLVQRPYKLVAANVMHLKHVLEMMDDNLSEQQAEAREHKSSFHDDALLD